MVVWGCPGQPVTPTVHCSQVIIGGGGANGGKGEGGELCWPRPALWLAKARDNRSLQKIISICLGHSKVGQPEPPPAPPPKRTHGLGPSPGPAQIGVETTYIHPGKGRGLGEGRQDRQAGVRALLELCAVRVSWPGVDAPIRALGDPGRLLAIQAGSWRRPRWQQPRECVEMTPPGRRRSPLLTLAGKWSSSSGTINGDRLLRGSGGQCGGGEAGAEVKQHTDPQRGTAAPGSHGQSVQGTTTMGHHHHKGGTLTTWSYTTQQFDTSHDTTGSNKWFTWLHTTGSHTHNYTVGYCHTTSSPHYNKASYHNG